MISQKYRFHGHASLKYLFNNGTQARGRHLSVKYVANSRRHYPRVSVVVSKKVFKHAVDRNRVRRRVYEVMREFIPQFQNTIDVAVTIYRAEVATMPHDELVGEIAKCLTKLDIIE